VYLVEKLAADFARRHGDITVRHARFPETRPGASDDSTRTA
jgi:uncharacterized protein (DUF924 family)